MQALPMFVLTVNLVLNGFTMEYLRIYQGPIVEEQVCSRNARFAGTLRNDGQHILDAKSLIGIRS